MLKRTEQFFAITGPIQPSVGGSLFTTELSLLKKPQEKTIFFATMMEKSIQFTHFLFIIYRTFWTLMLQNMINEQSNFLLEFDNKSYPALSWWQSLYNHYFARGVPAEAILSCIPRNHG